MATSSDQLLPHKTCLETSYVFSHTFNSHVPNLIVAPQFPVWIVKHNDQLEDADDGDDPEEVEERAAQGEEDVAAGI
ncbi:hypothetical protein BDR03DRAFT_1010394 [Suillus americanus]|nr:hypothetical protein BDR03DRAFT_1010394 [Suillus americanus]